MKKRETKIAHVQKKENKERDGTIQRESNAFPPYSIHTLAHLDQVVWFLFYLDPVLGLATYVMQVCLIFIPTLSST
jgi:hypothetical protein